MPSKRHLALCIDCTAGQADFFSVLNLAVPSEDLGIGGVKSDENPAGKCRGFYTY